MIFMGMSIASKVWRWKSRVSCCSTMGCFWGWKSCFGYPWLSEGEKGFYRWSKSGVPLEEPEFLPKKPNYWNFFSQDMSSNVKVAEFTTGNSEPIVCQRCLQSSEAGTELYFMHDSKPDRRGKRVCASCRQYYLRKTETRQVELASSVSQSTMNNMYLKNLQF